MKGTSLILFFCYFSCFLVLKSQANQGDALQRLFDAKYKQKSDIDIGFYGEVELVEKDIVLPQGGLKEKDKIEKLPGQPSVNFTQYGGYVTVDADHGRAFYYYFVEAEKDKESKPLLLWLNGGPGCSSLAYGAMEEHGPFRVRSDGKTLFRNRFSWNKVANVLFVESPAGVGFSYSNTTSDYKLSGDKMTARDNYAFLVNWLERYPEYKSRDFFISGESYAGHYVPQLAHTILQHNKAAKNIINLKGIIIGNAVINDETDQVGMYDYFWTHALLSDESIYNIHNYCNLTSDAPANPQCASAANEVNRNIGPIDIYSIYAPICIWSNLTDKPRKDPITKFDPCSEYFVYAYMNTPAVQEALHANVTRLNYTWDSCSVILNAWADSPNTIIPLLQEFIKNKIRVWVFSGDTDGRVPVTSTRYSLNKMKLPIKSRFRPWYNKEEVGGYTIDYEGLTFATVRGAGHMVPSYQPSRALSLITHFLEGTPLH
ncbi:hypothetical protein Syun_017573 [Stephania yunnanensis]|uniref:Carboxypeptidase n=1 Tax=Stephania yunnanensis TaxID=152371 RepID=A0AAP0J9F9_9MAGN